MSHTKQKTRNGEIICFNWECMYVYLSKCYLYCVRCVRRYVSMCNGYISNILSDMKNASIIGYLSSQYRFRLMETKYA